MRRLDTPPEAPIAGAGGRGLAHQFGADVVAEGVEHEGAMAVLAALGCDYAQGFLCGRPGPPADLARSMRGRGPSVR